MDTLPTLDAHGHLNPNHAPQDLSQCSAVLAMTFSIEETARVMHRDDPLITWAVGSYP